LRKVDGLDFVEADQDDRGESEERIPDHSFPALEAFAEFGEHCHFLLKGRR
jgi:hypothetical protein